MRRTPENIRLRELIDWANGLGGKQSNGNPPEEANSQTKRQNNNQKGKPGTGNSSTGFRGDTEKMKGFVFELPARDSQMTDTLDMLKRYVRTTYTSAPAMGTLFLHVPTAPTVKKPASKPVPTGEPEKEGGPPTLTDFDTELFKERVRSYGKKVELLERELISFFSVIFGQCGHTLRAELRSLAGFAEAELNGDCLWILAAIRGALTKFDKGNYVHEAIHDLWARFYKEHQGTRSTVDYFNNFETLIKTLQENGAIGAPPLTQDPDPDVIGRSDEETRRNLRERSLAVALIKNSDNRRFGQLKDDLKANYARGTDQWPKTLVAAYNLLVAHERHETAKAKAARRAGIKGGGNPGTNGPKGHQFAMASAPPFPRGCILLDSESSESIFNDLSMLSNVREGIPPLTLHTNGGARKANQRGDYHGLGTVLTVWADPGSLANILALRDVRRIARVTLDTEKELAFIVHLPSGGQMRFAEHDSTGLYVHNPVSNEVKIPVKTYSYLQTIAGNRQVFSRRELDAADTARALHRQIGRPSQSRFEKYLTNNLIRNCPVTVADAKRAAFIYGPDPAYLKGKTTQQPALPHIPTTVASPLPDFIREHHRNITLCADFFFVQGAIFLHIISRKIGFRTSVAVTNRSKTTILRVLRREIKTYSQRGFNVRDVHADQEFECVCSELLGVHLHNGFGFLSNGVALETCTSNDHIGEIERSVRTVKEVIRSTAHGMPYRRLPRQLIHGLVEYSTRTLNAFPYHHGVSQTLSPSTIVTGRPMPDYNGYKLEFGSYVMLTDKTTNTPRARTFGAIAMYPSDNADGSYRFMSLVTGEVVTKAPGYWTELPISDPTIARVEYMAKSQGQPALQETNFLAEYSPDQVIDEDEYDKNYDFVEDEDEDLVYDTDTDDSTSPGTDDAHDGSLDEGPEQGSEQLSDPEEDLPDGSSTPDDQGASLHTQPIDAHNTPPTGKPPENEGATGAIDDPDTPSGDDGDEGASEDTAIPEHNGTDVDGDNNGTEDDEASGDEEPTDQTGYNLRSNRSRSYDHRFITTMENPASSQSYEDSNSAGYNMFQINATSRPTKEERILHGWVMTQMSARAGIRRFGDAARDAMRSEFRQLDEKGVFDPVQPTDITQDVKSQALRCINVIKQKRCGKIKGRTCADGRPQRDLYDKTETSSPTASSDAILLTLVIDALERRDVATADVAGAYLNANMEDYVLMRLTGDDVSLMCDVNPTYGEYVTKEGNTTVLYLRLAKALYGCVKSAMLWYRLFTSTLQKLGFVLNPYDPCVANADIEGKQCTIVWYVDDNKVSHCSPHVVSDIIKKIEGYFGKMTVTRGNEHDFLGMHIVFNKSSGTATITMSSYIHEAINESGMDIRRKVATPATSGLFTIDPTAAPLARQEADMFRRIVCKLLYVGLRARTDILTALSFLSTRITRPSVDDYKKLRRLLEYLWGTVDMGLTLGADHLGTIYTWVDASYAVHADMRSHTGGVISFGIGGLLCKSSKQKLNTKSSTEAELIGASDYLPNTIWVMEFMKAQGYPIQKSRFSQDNESAIRLERNGRASAGQKSRHINIRHFWITDRLRNDDIQLQHCPTESMLADFLTKPLQGNLFRKFRSVLLGDAHISSLSRHVRSPSEERVEKPECANQRVSWADVLQGKSRLGEPGNTFRSRHERGSFS